MKFSLSLLFATTTVAAFAPATINNGSLQTSSPSSLQAAPLSASEIEGLLSGPKLQWYQGKAESKKGDAVLVLELEERIKSLKADIAAGKFSAIDDDECSIDDSRIECMLSPIERLWYRGRGTIQNEAQANQELKRLTQKAADLSREIRGGLSTETWGKLNVAA